MGVPDASKVAKRFSMEIVSKVRHTPELLLACASCRSLHVINHLLYIAVLLPLQGGQSAILCAESKDEQEAWLQALSCAAVPEAWPGGLDLAKRPQPLLYSMWILKHTPPGA